MHCNSQEHTSRTLTFSGAWNVLGVSLFQQLLQPDISHYFSVYEKRFFAILTTMSLFLEIYAYLYHLISVHQHPPFTALVVHLLSVLYSTTLISSSFKITNCSFQYALLDIFIHHKMIVAKKIQSKNRENQR